jgi:hypothetical protein
MDYTFNQVNQHQLPIAPIQAMQFGSAFQRLAQCLVYANPAFGAPLLAKIDLADGYYRVPLSPEAALELAVILPADENSQKLIGVPLSLPMGWAASPPYFCAFTETGADLANAMTAHTCPIPHPLELDIQTTPFPPSSHHHHQAIPSQQTSPPPEPLQYVDIYIDEFMAVAQPPTAPHVMRCLLHSIDSVFIDPPNTCH